MRHSGADARSIILTFSHKSNSNLIVLLWDAASHLFVLETLPGNLSSLCGRVKGINPAYAGDIMVGIVTEGKQIQASRTQKYISKSKISANYVYAAYFLLVSLDAFCIA